MEIESFFDPNTWTLSYLVHDGECGIVIDPVLDYDPGAGRTSCRSASAIAHSIDRANLEIAYVIDTHAHADHMTALPYFKKRYGAQTVTGVRIGEIQATFRDLYDLDPEFPTDGSQFDVLVDEGKRLPFGTLGIEAIETPGHTPAHMSWKIDDAVFVGDTLFMPDYGTARCDFPGGSATDLFDSIQRIYALPDETRLFMCHDYRPSGRPLAYQSSVAEQKRSNVHIRAHTTREEFVSLRESRDETLAAPSLLLPSMQVNIRAGEFPPPGENGTVYLKIPLNRLGGASTRVER